MSFSYSYFPAIHARITAKLVGAGPNGSSFGPDLHSAEPQLDLVARTMWPSLLERVYVHGLQRIRSSSVCSGALVKKHNLSLPVLWGNSLDRAQSILGHRRSLLDLKPVLVKLHELERWRP